MEEGILIRVESSLIWSGLPDLAETLNRSGQS
jgi:hypothetical protein